MVARKLTRSATPGKLCQKFEPFLVDSVATTGLQHRPNVFRLVLGGHDGVDLEIHEVAPLGHPPVEPHPVVDAAARDGG